MIIHFCKASILPSSILFIQNSGEELNQFHPPTHRDDDLCLLFCLYPSSIGEGEGVKGGGGGIATSHQLGK